MSPRRPHRPVPQEHQTTEVVMESYNIHRPHVKGTVLGQVEGGKGTKRGRRTARSYCSGPRAQERRPFCKQKANREMLPGMVLLSSSSLRG